MGLLAAFPFGLIKSGVVFVFINIAVRERGSDVQYISLFWNFWGLTAVH